MGVDGKKRFWMAGRLGGGKKNKLNYRTQVFPGGLLGETKLRQEAQRTKREATE